MYGREMPWRHNADPYKVLISEIMLQQTQVDRVRPKYEQFLKLFPDFEALAQSSVAEVSRAWQGLGYNRRALALRSLAQVVVDQYGGKLPQSAEELDALPGIGPATAGSLSAFAHNLPVPFIETNIRRVYIHFFFPRSKAVSDEKIMKLVDETLDRKRPRDWFYALMDYGTFLKTKVENPNRKSKHYTKQSRFEGSRRQVRGAVLRRVLAAPATHTTLSQELGFSSERIDEVVRLLVDEGFLKQEGNLVLAS